MKELWKPIIINPKYAISSKGRVKHIRFDRILKQRKTHEGYPIVPLNFNGKSVYKNVARLVAMNFLDNPENKPQVNHKNGVKTDNNIKNLEWCTGSENMKHAFKMGLIVINKGEESNFSKLTEHEVKLIRSYYNENAYSYKEMARIFRVSKGCINHIVNRRNWKHI
jgi:hypothetical protein